MVVSCPFQDQTSNKDCHDKAKASELFWESRRFLFIDTMFVQSSNDDSRLLLLDKVKGTNSWVNKNVSTTVDFMADIHLYTIMLLPMLRRWRNRELVNCLPHPPDSSDIPPSNYLYFFTDALLFKAECIFRKAFQIQPQRWPNFVENEAGCLLSECIFYCFHYL